MALPAPTWRIKSRPCPFYQQGRCLFADSCNFVHAASVQRPQSEQPLTPQQKTQSSSSEPSSHSPTYSPTSARSPPRSPRTAGLLLALKGVIADDPDDNDTNKIPSPTNTSSRVSIEPTNPIINTDSKTPLITPAINRVDSNQDIQHHFGGKEPSPFSLEEAGIRPVIRTIQSSPTEPRQENISPLKSNDLLSPVDSVNFNLMTFNLRSPLTLSPEDEVIDSGFAETFPSPSKHVPSAPSSPLKATFGVLSSPCASPASRVLSPRLSAFIGHPPQDLEEEPLYNTSLDSPTDHYSHEIQGSEEFVVVEDNFDWSEQLDQSHHVQHGEDVSTCMQETPEHILQMDFHQVHVSPVDQSKRGRSPTCEDNTSLVLQSRRSSAASHTSPSWPEQSAPVPISRSSSRDEDDDPLSFSDLFVSTAAMESQTTVDFEVDEEDSPLGLIYAEYSDSPHSEETRDLEYCESLNKSSSPISGPMPSPFSPVSAPTAALHPGPSLLQESPQRDGPGLASLQNLPPLSYSQTSSPGRDSSSLGHSTAMSSPSSSLAQRSLERHQSPSMTFETFFSGEDLEEGHVEEPQDMRPFGGTLSSHPSPPLSQAKAPSPVPPVQEQLRPIPPPSESSISMSALSPPSGLRPGSSQSMASRSVPTPDSPVPDSETASRKVPFGFRHSVSNRFSKLIAPSRPVSIAKPPTPQGERAFSPEEAVSPNAANRSGLRPLRLSLAIGPFSAPSYNTSFPVNLSRNSIRSQRESLASSPSHVSLHNRLLSFTRTSTIPEHSTNTNISSEEFASPLSSYSLARLRNFDDPRTAPLSYSSSLLHTVEEGPNHDYEDVSETSLLSPPRHTPEDGDQASEEPMFPLPSPFPVAPHSAPAQQVHRPPMYAIGTPKATLLFAIASDDVNQVRQALESGEVNPNETVGPQSALEFALTNDQLVNKMEIVKTLLAFGADPKALHTQKAASPQSAGPSSPARAFSSPPKALMEAIDPATRYYVERADASNTRRTSALIHRSFFRPLTRVRYELIGQDRALEEMFKVLSIHSRKLSTTPIVVLICGPSGHGKSLLARKFGTLLDVPTHTVNMTALDSTQDLWRSYSMSPYETPSMCTLAEFLINNEGKRCVVVLDEIEKTRDEKTLWSLLMPWELGRCTFEANGRPVDCRNVVWLGTSNIGHDLVLEHHQARSQPESLVTREEYIDLMKLLRPKVSQRLGASILSRVTSVLPFVPFTTEEKRAICYEALHATGGDIIRTLSKDTISSMVDNALVDYIADEGARSLYRAVSNQLLDNI